VHTSINCGPSATYWWPRRDLHETSEHLLIHTKWKVPLTSRTNPGTSVHISFARLQTCCHRNSSHNVFRLSATKPTRSGRHVHLPVRFTPYSSISEGGWCGSLPREPLTGYPNQYLRNVPIKVHTSINCGPSATESKNLESNKTFIVSSCSSRHPLTKFWAIGHGHFLLNRL
jgi:hypothetical protein